MFPCGAPLSPITGCDDARPEIVYALRVFRSVCDCLCIESRCQCPVTSKGSRCRAGCLFPPRSVRKKNNQPTNNNTTSIVSRPLNGMVFGNVCNSSLKGVCNERIRCFWGKTQHFWRCLPVCLVVVEEEEVTFPRKITNRWAGDWLPFLIASHTYKHGCNTTNHVCLL